MNSSRLLEARPGFMNGERGKRHIVNNLTGYRDTSSGCGGSARPMQIPIRLVRQVCTMYTILERECTLEQTNK